MNSTRPLVPSDLQFPTLTRDVIIANRARDFAMLTRLMAVRALQGETSAGQWLNRATEGRPSTLLKAAVPAGGTNASDYGADLVEDMRNLVGAFSESMRSRGFVFPLLAPDGFVRVPAGLNAAVLTAGVDAYVVGEAKPKPISRVTTNSNYLTPRKAVGIIVISNELALSSGESGRLLFENELRRAVSVAVDREALNVITSGVSSTSSAGADFDDAVTDLKTLLSKIEVRGGRVVFLAAPDVALGASLLSTGVGLGFPGMTPQGGLIAGIQTFLSDALDPGQLVAVNLSHVAADAADFNVRVGRHAAIEMLDAALQQDGTTGAGANLVSLFQGNMIAILSEVRFALEVIRDGGVAAINDIGWALAAAS